MISRSSQSASSSAVTSCPEVPSKPAADCENDAGTHLPSICADKTDRSSSFCINDIVLRRASVTSACVFITACSLLIPYVYFPPGVFVCFNTDGRSSSSRVEDNYTHWEKSVRRPTTMPQRSLRLRSLRCTSTDSRISRSSAANSCCVASDSVQPRKSGV
ncbi:hypothetical protein EDB84DRAFT_1506331 [Lactarius hengduanensis]|nr:hypothetical protein EDB84DRAFT_1506331 [Lactarius hengduanensis]